MNKSAFVEKMMASDKFASKKEAEIALSVVLDTIVDSVANEDGVRLLVSAHLFQREKRAGKRSIREQRKRFQYQKRSFLRSRQVLHLKMR